MFGMLEVLKTLEIGEILLNINDFSCVSPWAPTSNTPPPEDFNAEFTVLVAIVTK